jgi:hypothetical protein
MTQESTGFDFKKYIIEKGPEKRTLTITETGETFEISVKELAWSKRNQLISKSLQFTSSGNTTFFADVYVRECLKEMITEAPWGNTTESFLLQIDNRLGSALEELVPTAFDDVSGAAETIKKGQ